MVHFMIGVIVGVGLSVLIGLVLMLRLDRGWLQPPQSVRRL